MKLLEVYKAIAAALNIDINEESGAWEMSYNGDTVPVLVSVRRGSETENLPLVMPTREVLKLEEDGTTIKFHPFAESPFAAQSEVLNKLVMLAGGRVCMAVQGLVSSVIELSLQYEQHGNYSNNVMKVIENMPSIKKDKQRQAIYKYADKVAKAHHGIRGPHTVLRFNLRRNKDVDGEQFIRYTTLSMPVLDSNEDEMRIFGVKAPNKAAFQTVMGAYRAILGDESTAFGYGVKSQTAPYFRSFMGCFALAAEHINKVAKKLGKHGRKEYRIDTSWKCLLDEADTLVKEMNIPFEGNVGSTNNKADEAICGEGANAPKAAAVQVELKRPNTQPSEVVVDTPAPTVSEETQMTTTTNSLNLPASPFRKQPGEVSEPVNPMMQAASATTTTAMNRKSFRKETAHAAAQPSTVQVEAAPKKQTAAVEIARPSQPQSHQRSSSAVTIEHHVREIHLHDSLGQPLFLANGQPWMVPENEKPTELFAVVTTPDGHPIYNGDKPRLESITQQEINQLRYGRPQQQGGYPQNGYGQPWMGHPGNPAAARLVPQQQQPAGYGSAHAIAQRPQYPQQPAYGQPQQPVYGQPAYGQPQQQAYGYNQQPVYGQPQSTLKTGYLHG